MKKLLLAALLMSAQQLHAQAIFNHSLDNASIYPINKYEYAPGQYLRPTDTLMLRDSTLLIIKQLGKYVIGFHNTVLALCISPRDIGTIDLKKAFMNHEVTVPGSLTEENRKHFLNDTHYADSMRVKSVAVAQMDLSQSVEDINTRMYRAGLNLKGYSNTMYTGIIIQAAGGAAIVIGATSSKQNNGLITGGSIACGVGWFITLFAHGAIHRAGIELQGNSVSVPLHR